MTTPEHSYLTATRAAYDTVAADYAELLRDELAARPLDRAMLAAFAELAQGAGLAGSAGDVSTAGSAGLAGSAGSAGSADWVADIGCGPGRVTAHLRILGLRAFGIDLSPAMLAEARRANPGLWFAEGSMEALGVADGALSGVVAWYSIIHTPPARLPLVLGELGRVLRPGGYLLLAFQAGDERVHLAQGYGHAVSLDAYRLPPDRVTRMLTDAGLPVQASMIRDAGPRERTPQAFLLARKSLPPNP